MIVEIHQSHIIPVSKFDGHGIAMYMYSAVYMTAQPDGPELSDSKVSQAADFQVQHKWFTSCRFSSSTSKCIGTNCTFNIKVY